MCQLMFWLGKTNGLQIAGFNNVNMKTVNGAQFSTFSNFLRGDLNGFHASGFSNIVLGNVTKTLSEDNIKNL